MMNCDQLHAVLDRVVEGTLDDVTQARVDRHALECTACRDLLAVIREDISPVEDDAPADLAAGVLARTGSDPCRRSRDLLCSHVDGDLAGDDGELLGLHLHGCAECHALEVALVHLAEDLPAMAEIDPGPAFTHRVVAATVPRRSARDAVAWLQAWWQRPRFALEAAYVLTLVGLLVFGVPRVVTSAQATGEIAAAAPQAAKQLAGVAAERIDADVAEPVRTTAGKIWDRVRDTGSLVIRNARGQANPAYSETATENDEESKRDTP